MESIDYGERIWRCLLAGLCAGLTNPYLTITIFLISSTTEGLSSVDKSPEIASLRAMLRNKRRMIFPERVFGSAFTKIMSSGFAIAPISLLTISFNSVVNSVSLVLYESLHITKAQIDSPLMGCCLPTTATSEMDG